MRNRFLMRFTMRAFYLTLFNALDFHFYFGLGFGYIFTEHSFTSLSQVFLTNRLIENVV